MHLFEAGFRHGLIEVQTEPELLGKSVFISPMLLSVPEDGVLNYVTIENAQDYLRTDDRDVVMFREDQEAFLRLVIDGAAFFDTTVQVLYGIAGATYDDWFDACTHGLERVAYHGFLSEFQMSVAAAELQAAKEETQHASERRHLTEEGRAPRYGDYAVGEDTDVD